ncbi:rcc01693 family protein [Xanthobacter sp. TB0139]|uniref:rcc01693 family protein n=1 Tax=Xanthobacter sp. TB0139 TaxID=3459178 RepID=UPI004039F902
MKPAPTFHASQEDTPPHHAPWAFPWAAAMGAGLGLLRLPPEQFWRMTPRELALALEAISGAVSGEAGLSRHLSRHMTRDELGVLMARFPDDIRTQEHGA